MRTLCYEITSSSSTVSRFRAVDYCHLGSDVVYSAIISESGVATIVEPLYKARYGNSGTVGKHGLFYQTHKYSWFTNQSVYLNLICYHYIQNQRCHPTNDQLYYQTHELLLSVIIIFRISVATLPTTNCTTRHTNYFSQNYSTLKFWAFINKFTTIKPKSRQITLTSKRYLKRSSFTK